MTHAYSESYLDDAINSLGDMMDYVVNDYGYDADIFFGWFISCGIAEQFGTGNPKYVAGMSGVELASETIYRTTGARQKAKSTPREDASPVYWAGWSMAYYQWYKGIRFRDLQLGGLTISKVISMYILHEADLTKFVEAADGILQENGSHATSRLQTIRKARGFTQQELSQASGVTLRMIKLYEQRKSDINSDSVSTVSRLASVLGCQIGDIMEISLT